MKALFGAAFTLPRLLADAVGPHQAREVAI
jgi:hypothetical protein